MLNYQKVNHCFRHRAELMGLSLLIAAAALVFKAEAEFHCRECKDTNLRHVCRCIPPPLPLEYLGGGKATNF